MPIGPFDSQPLELIVLDRFGLGSKSASAAGAVADAGSELGADSKLDSDSELDSDSKPDLDSKLDQIQN